MSRPLHLSSEQGVQKKTNGCGTTAETNGRDLLQDSRSDDYMTLYHHYVEKAQRSTICVKSEDWRDADCSARDKATEACANAVTHSDKKECKVAWKEWINFRGAILGSVDSNERTIITDVNILPPKKDNNVGKDFSNISEIKKSKGP